MAIRQGGQMANPSLSFRMISVPSFVLSDDVPHTVDFVVLAE